MMAKSGKGAPRRMKNDSINVVASYKKKKVEKVAEIFSPEKVDFSRYGYT